MQREYMYVSWILLFFFLFQFLPRTNDCLILYHLRNAPIQELFEQYKVQLGSYVMWSYVTSSSLFIIDGFWTFRSIQPGNRKKNLCSFVLFHF